MIAELRPYPSYVDSGLLDAARIPAHWQLRRLKQLSRMEYGDALPKSERGHGEVPVFGSNGRVGWHTTANTQAPCIIVGRKGSFGKVNLCRSRAFVIDTAFFIDPSTARADIDWLSYMLGWIGLDEVSKDSAIPGLDRDDAYQQVAPLPPPEEQAAIVRFLDWASGRLERAIRAKRKIIALLEEQKQAVIHRAVTRGLDPSVPLKPSGIPWLGNIPAHWEVRRLKFLATDIVDCLHATPRYSDTGIYPAIRTADIRPGLVSFAKAKKISEKDFRRWTERLRPTEGDVLYSREGERFGIAACVPSGVQLCISQRMMVFRISKDHSSAFVMWLLNSTPTYAQALQDVMGATAPHVNISTIRNYVLAMPPKEEQAEIVGYVDREVRSLDATAQALQREIDLLREYRTRLVADVVTGKLDVREAAARLPAEPAPADLPDDDPEPLEEEELLAHAE